jgi:transposase
MAEGGKEAGRGDDAVVAAITVRGLQQPIRDLERLLGNKTLEIEILRTPLRLCGQKTVVARALAF